MRGELALTVAWPALLVAELAAAVYGLIAVLYPDQVLGGSYERFSGIAVSELRSLSPRTADYITLSGRLIGGLNLAYGTLGAAVVLWGLRRRARWAWLMLLVGGILGYGSPIAFDLTTGRIELFEYAEFLLLGIVFLALAISAGPVFSGKRSMTTPTPTRGSRGAARSIT